jgi:hypothetical protein
MSDNVERIRQEHGLFRNVPRALRRAVERRLRRLEADAEAFDREALTGHARLKRLHALLHIEPGERARATLFGRPPPGSPRAALRKLAGTKDPIVAAALVSRYRIPYLLAEAALGKLPEEVAVVLVETMPGAELLARLPALARRDLLTGRVSQALLRRFAELATDPAERFAYAKVESVVRQAGLAKPLAAAAFALVAAPDDERLAGDTALVADASGSMAREGDCLELAANVGWRLDQALEPGARLDACLTHETAAAAAVRRGGGLAAWRAAFTAPVPEAPGTSLGAAVELLGREGIQVGRLLLVTDGYENRPPRLATALRGYRTWAGHYPAVHLVQPAGTTTQLAVDLRNAQIPFGVFTVDAHLLGLAALVPALGAPAGADRVSQILAFR